MRCCGIAVYWKYRKGGEVKRIVLSCTFGVILAMAAQAGELYRWVDANGKVHYSDTPPSDKTKAERKNLSSSATQNADLPYETLRAQQNFPVTLFVGLNCGELCDKARGLLNKRGVPFSEKLLKTKEEIEAFAKLAGSMNSPALKVGNNYLSGFSESRWNGELDIAGYPKTASYRQRMAPPKPPASEAGTTDGKPAEGQAAEGSANGNQTSPAQPAEQ